MLQKIRQKLNGNLSKVIEIVILGAVILWTFCQVRDLPAIYATKAELSESVQQAKQDREKQFDRIFQKLNDIETFLRDKRK